MFKPKELVTLVVDSDQTAASNFLTNSGIQFRVINHPGWTTYDPTAHTLVDKDQGGAVVPAKVADITHVRFGDGPEIMMESARELVMAGARRYEEQQQQGEPVSSR